MDAFDFMCYICITTPKNKLRQILILKGLYKSSIYLSRKKEIESQVALQIFTIAPLGKICISCH